MLPSPINGEVSVNGQMIGDTATYTCDSGFEFLDRTPGSDVRTCQSDGTWSGDEQQCACKHKHCNFLCIALDLINLNFNSTWFFCGCWSHCRRCGSCCADLGYHCSFYSSDSSHQRKENT